MGDALGDRMKSYEVMETGRRFLPLLPVYARIDGRNFSSFTRGMERPYDAAFVGCMDGVTRWLVEETGALVGYTQSDEISLLFYSSDPRSQIFFDGKIFKMVSVLAAMTSVKFGEFVRERFPDRAERLPVFDCRVFQLPTREEAANVFLWRELDATKNAIQMAARDCYSHKHMHGRNTSDMHEMLHEKGINFNNYCARFKRGAFFMRRKVLRELDAETLARIPEDKRPDGPIERQVVEQIEMPKFNTVTNRVGVLFFSEEPRTEHESTGNGS